MFPRSWDFVASEFNNEREPLINDEGTHQQIKGEFKYCQNTHKFKHFQDLKILFPDGSQAAESVLGSGSHFQIFCDHSGNFCFCKY